MSARDAWAGVGALLVTAAVGAAVLVIAPAGGEVPVAGAPLAPSLLINTALLALAPVVGLLVAYRGVSDRSVEPYGASTERRIGRRVWAGLLVLSASVTAVALARHAFVWAAVWTVLGPGSFWLAIEGERRARRDLAPEAWTDDTLDRVRLHVEVGLVAGLWVAVGLVIWAANGSEPGARPVEYLLAVPWVAVIVGYRGLWMYPPPEMRGVRAAVLGYWLSALFCLLLPYASLRVAFLLFGVTVVPAALERVRRRAIRRRISELADHGHTDLLSARYPKWAHSTEPPRRRRTWGARSPS